MAFRLSPTCIILEVGDKVTPDWIYFEGHKVMTPGRVLTIERIYDSEYDTCLSFAEVSYSYQEFNYPFAAYMFRLAGGEKARDI